MLETGFKAAEDEVFPRFSGITGDIYILCLLVTSPYLLVDLLVAMTHTLISSYLSGHRWTNRYPVWIIYAIPNKPGSVTHTIRIFKDPW